jgi:hypothetical protein
MSRRLYSVAVDAPIDRLTCDAVAGTVVDEETRAAQRTGSNLREGRLLNEYELARSAAAGRGEWGQWRTIRASCDGYTFSRHERVSLRQRTSCIAWRV